MNLLKGFKLFAEQEPQPQAQPEPNPQAPEEKHHQKGQMVGVLKKQLGIPKKVYLGMPIIISNAKIGSRLVREPTAFTVVDHDKNTVTLRKVRFALPDETEDGSDADDEIDLEKHIEGDVTISRKDFEDLQEPQGMQPGGMAGGGMGGGLGGMGL